MPMRGELAPPALRDRWRETETAAVRPQLFDDVISIDSWIVTFSAAGLLLTLLAMLIFPASATEIAVAIGQLC